MISFGLLLMMVCSVLIAVRAVEIAADRIHDTFLPLGVGFAWIAISVASFMVLICQWVAYMRLPAGGTL